ncbi:MAG: hypothetical protein FJX80_14580 [Bacteroidetes bacterium]|nr:hypothetical protein [Bacteroidota bacterium]
MFRVIWNGIFILSYPILASFGLIFIGITYLFSTFSKIITRIKPDRSKKIVVATEWEVLPQSQEFFEAKLEKQILFGPSAVKLRRKDGVPSVLNDYVFGKKIKSIEQGFILEKWNSLDLKELPNFDICLYDPSKDSLRILTTITCFDWHLAEEKEQQLLFKWFDGTQGGECLVEV